jgi:hypothetical protein
VRCRRGTPFRYTVVPEADIEAARYDPGDRPIQLPVKLKVSDGPGCLDSFRGGLS